MKEINKENEKTPILVCHGTSDFVVAHQWGQLSFSLLESMRKDNLTWKEYQNMGHSSCVEELNDIDKWMSKIIN